MRSKIFGFGIVLFLLYTGFYLHHAKKNFTCHECMSVPSLKTAFEEKSLIAIYTSTNTKIKDTLYLTQANIHGEGYYTESYFVGYTGILDTTISEIVSNTSMASVKHGEITAYMGINEIPKQINCKDSMGIIIYNFSLIKTYQKNIDLGSKKSYLKQWKTILKNY